MTTQSTPSNRHLPIIPLNLSSYSYPYPNHDSIPYSTLPNRVGIYNAGILTIILNYSMQIN